VSNVLAYYKRLPIMQKKFYKNWSREKERKKERKKERLTVDFIFFCPSVGAAKLFSSSLTPQTNKLERFSKAKPFWRRAVFSGNSRSLLEWSIVKMLLSKVRLWPYSQILDCVEKACQEKTL
jgi:hypothetical protein